MSRVTHHAGRFISAVVLLAVLLAGCAKSQPEPKTVAVLDPALTKQVTLNGQLVTTNGEDMISPDGKYLLAGIRGKPAETMSAIPIQGGPAQGEPAADPATGAGDAEPIVLYSVDSFWTRYNLVQWYPVGWLSNTKCAFIVHGWQSQGEHKGERGAAIFTADLETKTSTMIGYVPVSEQGQMIDSAALSGNGKMYMRVRRKLWEINVATGDIRLVRGDLNEDYGISTSAMSPTGTHLAYEVYQEAKSGIFLIDLSTGEEKVLIPDLDSLSFFPAWSPDGKYVAAYTVQKLPPESPEESVPRYNFIPGEDGPMSSGQAITVVDLDGNVVKTITVEGRYLSHFAWLSDSESLVYLAGPVAFGKWGEVTSFEYATAHIASVSQDAPVKVADISEIEKQTGEHTAWVFPVGSLPEGKGALLDVAGAEGASVWRVSTSSEPAKVTDGWWQTARLMPEYLDSVAGVVGGGEQTGLWLVGDTATQFETCPSGTGIAAYNGELLVVESYDFPTDETRVAVYDMISEKVVEE
ncbi:MAG: TolB family protein [Bacillota bacterium]